MGVFTLEHIWIFLYCIYVNWAEVKNPGDDPREVKEH